MKNIFKNLIELVFPSNCFGCETEGVWLCDKCLDLIQICDTACCFWCNSKNLRGNICSSCKRISNLSSLYSITVYQNPIFQKMLHNLKYNFASSTIDSFAMLLDKYFSLNKLPDLPKDSVLIPIPLHKKRLAERGFNQSELIAREIEKIIHLDIDSTLLTRIKNTKSQMTLNKSDRIINMENSFACINSDKIRGKNIVLIDDVLTTGETIKEATQVLLKSGCASVSAIVMAKGGISIS